MLGISQNRPHAINSFQTDFAAEATIEKTGIARIKLRHAALGMTAMISGFFEADKLLAAWKVSAAVRTQCEFHITFTDGTFIKGHYPLYCGASGRPALCLFVRTCLKWPLLDRCPAKDGSNREIVDQHGRAVDEAILEYYEIER